MAVAEARDTLLKPSLRLKQTAQYLIPSVLQYTPTWAATNSADGYRGVPRNLYLPYDDPDNYWGQFVYQTVGRALCHILSSWRTG